jgi:hypothetical protein
MALLASLLWAGVPNEQKSQSLGEAARKARAEHLPSGAARTYTEDDLPRLRRLALSVVGNVDAQPVAAELRSHIDAEVYWREQFASARREVARGEARVAQLQQSFNQEVARAVALTDFGFLSCPASGVIHTLGYSRADRLTELCTALNEGKAELQRARQHLVDLPDELRRAGGYPGWGRD